MEINWCLIIIIAFCAVLLIVYLVKKNEKDRKDIVKELNNDYKKGDITESDNDDENH